MESCRMRIVSERINDFDSNQYNHPEQEYIVDVDINFVANLITIVSEHNNEEYAFCYF